MQVIITLTSPIIREENARDGGWKEILFYTLCSGINFSENTQLIALSTVAGTAGAVMTILGIRRLLVARNGTVFASIFALQLTSLTFFFFLPKRLK